MLQRPPKQFQRPPSAFLLASAPLRLHNAPWGAVRTTLGTIALEYWVDVEWEQLCLMEE